MQGKNSDLDEMLAFSIKLAKESAQLLLRMQQKAKVVVEKEKGDFALDADIESEKHIMKRIREKYPEHDILTEETKHQHVKSDYLWVIDPLEGTLNYAHKIPVWAVNIGLFYKKEPFIGVVYAPVLKELFHAAKGKGSYLNGKKIFVNKDEDLLHSFYSVSQKQSCKLSLSHHLMRHFGCVGLDLAYVACGRFGARIKLRGNDPYGYGAGSVLVLEAGGKITDTKGQSWKLFSNGALASNGRLHGKVLEMLR